MKPIILSLLFFTSLLSAQTNSKEVPLAIYSDAILKIVNQSKEALKKEPWKIKSAKVTLSGLQTTSKGGKLNIIIFSVGKKKTISTGSSLSLTINPGDDISFLNNDIDKLLQGMVQTIFKNLKAIELNYNEENSQGAYPSELSLSIAHTISSEGNGKISFNIIPAIVSADLSGAKASSAVQTLTITCVREKPE